MAGHWLVAERQGPLHAKQAAAQYMDSNFTFLYHPNSLHVRTCDRKIAVEPAPSWTPRRGTSAITRPDGRKRSLRCKTPPFAAQQIYLHERGAALCLSVNANIDYHTCRL